MPELTLYNTEPRVIGQMGRRAAKRLVGSKFLGSYGSLPTAPPACIRPTFASVLWGMLDNDKLGDCTFAGYWHALMAQCLLAGVALETITADQCGQAYLAFTGGQDTGCAEADVLSAAFKTGLMGQELTGYAQGKGGIVELCQIVNAFGAAYLGVWLTATDQQNFGAQQPWDTGSDVSPIGGHCIDAVEYDTSTGMAKVLTWGQEQLVTFAWLNQRVEEQWAIISSAINGDSIDGFDFAALEADCQSIGGTVASSPTTYTQHQSGGPSMSDASPYPETLALPTSTPAVPLPHWTDAGSVTAYIITAATAIIGVLTMAHVTVPANASAEVSTWAGIAGVAIAAGVQVANFARVVILHKSAILSGQPVAIKPTKRG